MKIIKCHIFLASIFLVIVKILAKKIIVHVSDPNLYQIHVFFFFANIIDTGRTPNTSLEYIHLLDFLPSPFV